MIFLACLIPLSLFLKAGFVSVSVIWFFLLCFYNGSFFAKDFLRAYYILLFPILLYFSYLIGLLCSSNLEIGVDIIIRKIHLVLLPLAFIIVSKKMFRKELHIILAVFLMTCLLSTLICLLSAIGNVIKFNSLGLQQGNVHYYYFVSHLLAKPLGMSPVYLSLYCNFALLIALESPFIGKKIYKTFVGFYLAVFIILCGSNAGIVSMCMIGILWLLNMGHKKILLSAVIALILTSILLFAYNQSLFKEALLNSFRFSYSNERGTLSDYKANRLVIWESAIEGIKENPIVGHGTGDGQKVLERKFREKTLFNEQRDFLNAHNEFLSNVLDVGILGLLILIAMLVVPFIQAIKAKDAIGIGFILIVATFFCIESVLLRQKAIVFFSFFYSAIFSVRREV